MANNSSFDLMVSLLTLIYTCIYGEPYLVDFTHRLLLGMFGTKAGIVPNTK